MKYTEKISSYWPEFGQNGKEDITVADLLRHEAGLAQFDLPLNVEDTLRGIQTCLDCLVSFHLNL